MSYYTKHIFFCVNQRTNGERCCNDTGAEALCAYAKTRIKALGLAGKAGIRVNKAGCLGRCDEGPVIVIYPDEIWYRYSTKEDIDEIIESHVQNSRIVEHLLLTNNPAEN